MAQMDRTLEVKEVISEAEERFETMRRTVGLFLGPVIAIILYLVPMPAISPQAHVLAAILGLVFTYWVTEPIPIPVTAVLGAMLCVILGVAPVTTAFAPFADPTIFLFLGSFIIAEAMVVHNLDRRFAFGILSMSWVGSSTARILLVYGFIGAFVSAWISNTATTAMMFPIGLGIIYAMADMISAQTGKVVDPKKLRFATGMMLIAAYGASVGGIATPVGTPPNLIGIAMIKNLAKIQIPFFQWMAFAYPLMILMFVILVAVLWFLHKPEVSRVEGGAEYIRREASKLGRWTRGQVNTLFAFSVAVILWIIPGFLAVLYGTEAPISKAYGAAIPESIAALVAAALLFFLPINWKNREFTMTWKRAVNIDWGTLLLFGGGLTLGKLMFDTKLAEAIGTSLLAATGANEIWMMVLAAIALSVIISEATSNTATANMIIPVMISLAMAANVNPVPVAIGSCLGASWGFMLPVSTPPNAIVYGSGMVKITQMIRAGIVFDIVGIIVLWIGLRIMLPLVGLA